MMLVPASLPPRLRPADPGTDRRRAFIRGVGLCGLAGIVQCRYGSGWARLNRISSPKDLCAPGRRFSRQGLVCAGKKIRRLQCHRLTPTRERYRHQWCACGTSLDVRSRSIKRIGAWAWAWPMVRLWRGRTAVRPKNAAATRNGAAAKKRQTMRHAAKCEENEGRGGRKGLSWSGSDWSDGKWRRHF